MPFASKIFTTFEESNAGLPKEKALYIGAVLREGIFNGDQLRAKPLVALILASLFYL